MPRKAALSSGIHCSNKVSKKIGFFPRSWNFQLAPFFPYIACPKSIIRVTYREKTRIKFLKGLSLFIRESVSVHTSTSALQDDDDDDDDRL